MKNKRDVGDVVYIRTEEEEEADQAALSEGEVMIDSAQKTPLIHAEPKIKDEDDLIKLKI